MVFKGCWAKALLPRRQPFWHHRRQPPSFIELVIGFGARPSGLRLSDASRSQHSAFCEDGYGLWIQQCGRDQCRAEGGQHKLVVFPGLVQFCPSGTLACSVFVCFSITIRQAGRPRGICVQTLNEEQLKLTPPRFRKRHTLKAPACNDVEP